jgi:hypothetical protein
MLIVPVELLFAPVLVPLGGAAPMILPVMFNVPDEELLAP